MSFRRRYDVFFSGDWITAGEWFQLSGTDKKSPDLRAQQYLRDRLIFSIRHGDVDYFPIYGLDVLNNYQPVAGLHEIIELLSLHKDGWAFALWFASPNSHLGDKAPKDLIQSDTQVVIAAALEEVKRLTPAK